MRVFSIGSVCQVGQVVNLRAGYQPAQALRRLPIGAQDDILPHLAPDYRSIMMCHTLCFATAIGCFQSTPRKSATFQVISLNGAEEDVGISETKGHRYQFSRWNAPSWMPAGASMLSKS